MGMFIIDIKPYVLHSDIVFSIRLCHNKWLIFDEK